MQSCRTKALTCSKCLLQRNKRKKQQLSTLLINFNAGTFHLHWNFRIWEPSSSFSHNIKTNNCEQLLERQVGRLAFRPVPVETNHLPAQPSESSTSHMAQTHPHDTSPLQDAVCQKMKGEWERKCSRTNQHCL